jgi:hypothetical protein
MSAERASESLLRPTVAAALLPRFTDSISGSRWMTWWRWRVHVVFGLRLLGLAFPALASAHSGVSVSASVPRMVLAGAEITVPGSVSRSGSPVLLQLRRGRGWSVVARGRAVGRRFVIVWRAPRSARD